MDIPRRLDEVQTIINHTPSVKDAAILIDSRFQYPGFKRDHAPRISRVSTNQTGPICYRSWTDDKGILMELLKNNVYRIPPKFFEIVKEQEIRVLDLGGNIGSASIFFQNQIHAALRTPNIVAVEPDPNNFGMLQTNISMLGRYVDIHPVQAAIDFEHTILRLSRPAGQNGTATFQTCNIGSLEDLEVKTVTAEDLRNLYFGGRYPHVIKCDIEGWEKRLAQDGGSFLEGARLLFIERHDKTVAEPDSFEGMESVLNTRGFVQLTDYPEGPGVLSNDMMFVASELFEQGLTSYHP